METPDDATDREAFRGPPRRLGVHAAVVETAVDIVLVLGLAFATCSATSIILRIAAAAAIGMIAIGWCLGKWRRLFRRA